MNESCIRAIRLFNSPVQNCPSAQMNSGAEMATAKSYGAGAATGVSLFVPLSQVKPQQQVSSDQIYLISAEPRKPWQPFQPRRVHRIQKQSLSHLRPPLRGVFLSSSAHSRPDKPYHCLVVQLTAQHSRGNFSRLWGLALTGTCLSASRTPIPLVPKAHRIGPKSHWNQWDLSA